MSERSWNEAIEKAPHLTGLRQGRGHTADKSASRTVTHGGLSYLAFRAPGFRIAVIRPLVKEIDPDEWLNDRIALLSPSKSRSICDAARFTGNYGFRSALLLDATRICLGGLRIVSVKFVVFCV
jgi:hypothetical protein